MFFMLQRPEMVLVWLMIWLPGQHRQLICIWASVCWRVSARGIPHWLVMGSVMWGAVINVVLYILVLLGGSSYCFWTFSAALVDLVPLNNKLDLILLMVLNEWISSLFGAQTAVCAVLFLFSLLSILMLVLKTKNLFVDFVCLSQWDSF